MTDATAKIRELLPKTIEELAEFTLRKSKAIIALLDAERPSVPMAMLCEIRLSELYIQQGRRSKGDNEIANKYGFDVKETP